MSGGGRWGVDAFARAMASETPPPCVHYDCAKRDECASQKLACQSFVVYTLTGKARSPLALYENLLRGDPNADCTLDRKVKVIGMTEAPRATRDLHDLLFPPKSAPAQK